MIGVPQKFKTFEMPKAQTVLCLGRPWFLCIVLISHGWENDDPISKLKR